MFVVLHQNTWQHNCSEISTTKSSTNGQTDASEDEDKRFFKEVVDKSVRDAISSHNKAFVDIFHNTMRETIHGFPVGQGRPTYYNILDPSTQGTNQVGTSHQEATLAGNGDV